MEMYKEIRKMRLENLSQRQIAKNLHISRNTVKKYWDGDSVPWERKGYSRDAAILTEDIITFVRNCLETDETIRLRKQHHTAKRIYDRLVYECNFTGGESTIRRLVQDLRYKTAEPFVPLAFPPGDALQVDWGEATVYLNDVKTVINLFCAKMCYSSAPFVLAYHRQNEESFLDAFVHTFQYFGGVPKHVIFDNGKVAVKDGFGANANKQAGYTALAAHYGFEAVFCNPASGNEKGLVEGLVGYIRRNVCVPIPRVKNIEELNVKLEEKCHRYLSHQIRGKEENVDIMLKEEQKALFMLPGYAFDPAKRATARVDRFSTIRFDTNNYSVPCEYCGKRVSIKARPEVVEVYFEGKLIASHCRCFEKKKTIFDLKHYLSLLGRKGRSILYAKPVQNNLPTYFLDWLSKQDVTPKEVTELLQRCIEEGCDAVMAKRQPQQRSRVIKDLVYVQPVDLNVYDYFLHKKAGDI